MYKLYDAGTNEPIGTVTQEQLAFLIDQLEEESPEDQDYYINSATIDMFESDGADAQLLSMLRNALGARPDMDIRWDTSPS